MQAVTSRPTHCLLAAVILLGGMLGGCLGDTDDETRTANEAVDPEPAETPVPRDEPARTEPVPLRFPLDAAVNRVDWHNGSFAPDETGLAGGFVTGTFVQHIELTEAVPPDVPTRVQVQVTIDAEHIPVVGPTARADPVSNGTLWYESYWRNPAPGLFEFGGVVKRASSGTIGVNIEAYTPGPNDPSQVDYAAQVHVAAEPDGVPLGVPVAVTAQGNETLRFQTAEGNQAELLVYGPDDRLLDRLFFVDAEDWTIPQGVTGELVVVPILGATDLRILHEPTENQTGRTLRALGLDRETGQPHDIQTTDVTTWDFDVEKRPLRVLVTVVGPAGEPWTCVGSLGVVLSAPEGTLLERTSDCPSPTNVPFLYEEERSWASHTGDARLVTGTYSVAVDNTFWSGHQAYHTVEWYAR